MGFDYNFDRDEPHVYVPPANKRRRWIIAAVLSVLLVAVVLIFRPRGDEGKPGVNNNGEIKGGANEPGGSSSVIPPPPPVDEPPPVRPSTTAAPAWTAENLAFSDARKAAVAAIENSIRANDYLSAKSAALALLKELPPYSPEWNYVGTLLGRANINIVMKKIPCDRNVVHTVKSGDTLKGITKKYNDMSLELLRKVNGKTDDHLSVGEKLVAYNAKWRIEINPKAGALAVYDDGELFKVYPIGVSEKLNLPPGDYVIPFSGKEKFAAGGDRDNPYGTRIMRFKNAPAAIHGTWENDPKTPFKNGYIRMSNSDVEELYLCTPGGVRVKVLN